MKNDEEKLPRVVELAVQIVTAHVRKTNVSGDDFEYLLRKAVAGINTIVEEQKSRREPPNKVNHSPRNTSPSSADVKSLQPSSIPLSKFEIFEKLQDPITEVSIQKDIDEGYIRNGVQTVFNDRIICLDDGREVVFLKRHLRRLNIDENDYKRRWRLPADYPMTTHDYVNQKKMLAKTTGFGAKLRPNRERRDN